MWVWVWAYVCHDADVEVRWCHPCLLLCFRQGLSCHILLCTPGSLALKLLESFPCLPSLHNSAGIVEACTLSPAMVWLLGTQVRLVEQVLHPLNHLCSHEKHFGEMAQWSGACPVLAEPRAVFTAHNCLWLQLQGNCVPLTSKGTWTPTYLPPQTHT